MDTKLSPTQQAIADWLNGTAPYYTRKQMEDLGLDPDEPPSYTNEGYGTQLENDRTYLNDLQEAMHNELLADKSYKAPTGIDQMSGARGLQDRNSMAVSMPNAYGPMMAQRKSNLMLDQINSMYGSIDKANKFGLPQQAYPKYGTRLDAGRTALEMLMAEMANRKI